MKNLLNPTEILSLVEAESGNKRDKSVITRGNWLEAVKQLFVAVSIYVPTLSYGHEI